MFKKFHPAVGARPGTLAISPHALPSRVRVVSYDSDSVDEQIIDDVSKLADHVLEDRLTWIDVQGLGDEQTLVELARVFEIHPLALEDVANVPQRAKSDAYEEQLLVIVRSIPANPRERLTQVSVVLGKNYVLTFQESHDDVLAPVRERIYRKTARLRCHGSDYLAYAILDTLVDSYYPVLESLGDQIERLENASFEHPTPDLLRQINQLKNRLVNLRRSLWPQRDAIQALIHDDSPLISEQVRLFLRDTADHCYQSSEVIDMYREMASGLLNTYLSSVGQRTNDVMKTLTILSSIFIPLTFIAGIYGMNFEHMPELSSPWAYPVVWFTMAAMVVGMLFFFRRKGWIGTPDTPVLFEQASETVGKEGTSRVALDSRRRRANVDDTIVTDTPAILAFRRKAV